MTPTILVFDSGLGGLTVHREVTKARPDARYVYAADDAFFPYGKQDEGKLVARVLTVMEQMIATHRPDLVVVACNTASTLVLQQLRERFKVPFVGTVPAIKPACAASKTRLVSVLGTEATVQREYTRALIRDFADGCTIHLVGSPNSPRRSCAASPWPTQISRARSHRVLSSRTARGPIRLRWPAPTTLFCWTG
jgi:glutamate racemase